MYSEFKFFTALPKNLPHLAAFHIKNWTEVDVLGDTFLETKCSLEPSDKMIRIKVKRISNRFLVVKYPF